MRDLAWLAGGIAIGTAATFYHVDTPRHETCGIPKVTNKVVTSYVLKPPPPIEHVTIVKEKCPAPQVEEAKAEEPAAEEKPRRRHRRHWRHRRYW